MDLSAFKASAANEPAFCHFAGSDGAPLFADDSKPVGVWMLGQDSDAITKLLNQQTDRYLKAQTPGAGVTAASARANQVELCAQAVLKADKLWQGIAFDGEDWPFDEEHARRLFTEVPLFREQAERFIRDRGNWQKVSPKT